MPNVSKKRENTKRSKEVEVRRVKGASEAGVRLKRPIDSRAETSCKVFAVDVVHSQTLCGPLADFV